MNDQSVSFPHFSAACEVVWRGEEGFSQTAYQYAMTSCPERVCPRAIISPSGPTADEDIAAAIRYAAKAGLSIAIRSGGHQYSGASSTWGDNLQLNLRAAYPDFSWDPETGIATAGVSLTVSALMAHLRRLGLFVPHGLCGTVGIGGHAQTGGYGMLIRSFGLFSDHIVAIDMITADGVKRRVRRGASDPDEAALFFATLGGSPGNLGVVTTLYIRPRHDKDHRGCRGLRLMAPYDRALARELIAAVVDFCVEDPPGLDIQLTIGSINPHFIARAPEGTAAFIASGLHAAPFQSGTIQELRAAPGTIMTVTLGYSDPDGIGQPVDPRWFDRLRQIYGPFWTWISRAGGFLDGHTDLPVSHIDRRWVTNLPREVDKPFVKFVQNSSDPERLRETRFVDDLVAQVDELAHSRQRGVQYIMQLTAAGGVAARNDPERQTGFSFRDVRINLVCDLFYDATVSPDAEALCRAHHRAALARFVGPDGSFSTDDCRYLWGSHGERDLDVVWRRYMEPEVHARTLAAKRRWDPHHVFSANKMCVGWSTDRPAPLKAPDRRAAEGIDTARLDAEMTRRWLAARHAARRDA